MTDAPQVNDLSLSMIKSFESFVPFVYDDMRPNRTFVFKGKRYGYAPWDGSKPRGTPTIGYGHTNAAKHPLKCAVGVEIDEPKACEILEEDLSECREAVADHVKVPLNPNQFGALVSFDFNTGGFVSSTLLKILNTGNYAGVPAQLSRWNKVDGAVVDGLTNRRNAEIKIWNTAI